MIYKTFNPLVGWAMRRYFKNIHITGLENVPSKSAVIFACNHPSSFMEPMLLAAVQPRKLYYLVRGDIFKGKIIKWMLKETHQIPIFRRRDGIANLKQNEKTFRICYKMLKEKGVLMIFPEGSTERVKHLRPLQRGIWRLAFGTLERHRNLDMVIIPVGVNFTDLDSIRSEVMVSFGKPLSLNDYMGAYEEDKAGVMRQLTPVLYDRMLPHVVHFNPMELEAGGNLLLALGRNEVAGKLGKTYVSGGEQLELEQTIASKFSGLPQTVRKALLEQAEDYLCRLPDGLDSDYVLMQENALGSPWRFALLAVPGAIGWLLGVLPYQFAVRVQKRLVNDDPPFHSPIRLALFLLSVLVLTLLSVLVLWPILGWGALVVFLSFYLIGVGTRMMDEWKWLKAKRNLRRSGLDQEALIAEHRRIMENLGMSVK